MATEMTPIAGAEIFRDPRRTTKPRKTGLTQVLDKGLSINEVEGMLEVAASYVDFVKFGWATSVVVENFEAKVETLRRHGIGVCCGGSLFELAVHRKKLNEYIAFLQAHDFTHVEVSDGTIHISLAEKLRYIERMAKHFTVFSEVGRKDRTHVIAPQALGRSDQERDRGGLLEGDRRGSRIGNGRHLSLVRGDQGGADRRDPDADRSGSHHLRGARANRSRCGSSSTSVPT